mmetsp:Transcript_3415/g.8124  ORF Transcript_3415/g.8124 Transcript_3415/m.8124 type:complete len:680 (-) Transcript_3415:56-2095(-)
MANVSMGSSSVTLDNVDDYLAPSQACVNPAFQPSSELGLGDKKAANESTSGNVVVPRRRRRVVRKKVNLATSDAPSEKESGTISLSRPKKVEEKKIVKASMADCLACSGCVTTAETVMMEERHSLKSLRNRLASKGDPRRVVTLSPNSWADLSRHWNLDLYDQDSNKSRNFYLSRLTTLLSKILSVQMVLDGNVPLQWAWMDEAQEFCDTYQKNEESGTKECESKKSNPPLPSLAIDSSKTQYYKADGTSEIKDNCDRSSPILPVISGSCPALVCLVEKNLTNLVPHLSQSISPMSLVGVILKDESNDGDATTGDSMDVSKDSDGNKTTNDVTWDHWAIMPCHDKKLEASRKDFAKKGSGEQAVDLVISTQECVELVEEWILSQHNQTDNPILQQELSSEISVAKYLASLPPSDVSTEILEPSDLIKRTSCANSTSPLLVTTPVIFHDDDSADSRPNSTKKQMAFSSGGHANYIFRYAAKKLFGCKLESENGVLQAEWKAASLAMKNVRSARLGKLLKQHYYEAKLYRYQDGSYGTTPMLPQNASVEESSVVVLHFAIAHGMQTMQRALKQVGSRSSLQYLEAMACPHGCVNGGGSARLSSPMLTVGADDKKTANMIRETPTETRKRVQTTLGYLEVPATDDERIATATTLPRTEYHVVPPMNYTTGAVAGEKVENMIW